MSISLDPIPSYNPHVTFAESLIESKLGSRTVKLMSGNYDYYKEEKSKPASVRLARQIGHILLLPFTVLAHVSRTVMDIAACAFSGLATVFSLGFSERIKHEAKARAYNLLVADTLIWASLPISILFKSAYNGARSLHLGTNRAIDMDTAESKESKNTAQPTEPDPIDISQDEIVMSPSPEPALE